MENQPQWKFRIPAKDEINQDPTQEEFFTTESVGDFSDALVRETIQNSLDAKSPLIKEGEIITVRFYFSGKKNACPALFNKHIFFKGLYNHIFAKDNGLDKKQFPNFDDNTEFLVIEDFYTTGLDGSVTEHKDPKDKSAIGHNFYWFWGNVGRTGKTNHELGKWGLGKTVFPAASVINSFFGLTNRYDDKKNYLMGLSVLKSHYLNNDSSKKRYPYGYFGNFTDPNFEYFATPIDDEKIIHEFRKLFKLRRSENYCPGLSIVIPFPRKDITSTSIIQSVFKQYFYPIIAGKLIVEICDNDNNIDIQINDKSIFHLLKKLNLSSEYFKLFNLCLWCIKLNEKNFINLNTPPIENPARWQMEWYLNDTVRVTIDEKIELFDKGLPVAFNVPVRIKEVDCNPEICFFKVFMEKDESLLEADCHFIRDGITITGIRKPRNKYLRGIILIEDRRLTKLLGLSENPAHTEWQKGSSHFRGKYDDGDKVINFIGLAFDKLSSLLSKPADGIDKEIMKDLFFIDLNDGEDANSSDDEPGDDSEKPITPTVSRKKTPFIIEQEKGGFILKKNPEIKWSGGSINVETAYMVVKGNPLKKYSQLDFDLSKPPLVITSFGVNNLEYHDNKIFFNVNSENDFSVQISGFDELRDLFIKATYNDKEI